MKDTPEIFLVDSNSFMTPYRFYYAFDLVPAYWREISRYIRTGQIVILDMVKNEITKGGDELAQWMQEIENLKIIKHVEADTIKKYQEIMQYIQECGLYMHSALETWANGNIADPWLIASAAVNGFTIVTEEVSSGGLSIKTPNRSAKIPDVAKHFGIKTLNVYDMMRSLNIKIE